MESRRSLCFAGTSNNFERKGETPEHTGKFPDKAAGLVGLQLRYVLSVVSRYSSVPSQV